MDNKNGGVEITHPNPVRLRAVTERSIGTTAFFRNRPLLEVLCEQMSALPSRRLNILVHAGSIGAEAWSLAIAAALAPRLSKHDITVTVTDIEPQFLEYARIGQYPCEILEGMTFSEREFFTPVTDTTVAVGDTLRSRVRFLPASSVEDFRSSDMFDVVMLLNVLLYMPGELQSQVLDQVAVYNRHLLITTGFHFDRIKQDMLRNGYKPIGTQARAIHDGWQDRRKERTSPDEVIPGKIFHPWSLPPFGEIADYEYKYCAIFEKSSI